MLSDTTQHAAVRALASEFEQTFAARPPVPPIVSAADVAARLARASPALRTTLARDDVLLGGDQTEHDSTAQSEFAPCDRLRIA